MDDCLIIGAGVVGLSLAWELAAQGVRVRLIDRREPGKEASWAGAGIFPPGRFRPQDPPLVQLAGLSNDLLPEWSARLKDETGIDNAFRTCGSLNLAVDADGVEHLGLAAADCRAHDVAVERLDPGGVARLEPAVDVAGFGVQAGLFAPEETQLRNPRHLQALAAACQKRGATIDVGVEAEDFVVVGGKIEAVVTNRGKLSAGTVCITTGAWTQTLAARLGFEIPIKPIRGQMVLLASERPIVERIIYSGRAYSGLHYVVPRIDGRLLVGSSLEDVGFANYPTPEKVDELLKFALRLLPALRQARFETSWAGLRPSTADDAPYMGPLPGLTNGFIAAGHFRAGLHLSPITAILMSRLIRGLDPEFDLSPFRVGRPVPAAPSTH